MFGDNLLSFLTIWTTQAVGDDDVEATVTIKNARWAALVHLGFGIVIGPWAHQKTGFTPLF